MSSPTVGESPAGEVMAPLAPVFTPVPPRHAVARRLKVDAKYFEDRGNGEIIPTLNAFLEDRPGGLSLDVFWDNGLNPNDAQKGRILEKAKVVCGLENHGVVGWCYFEVSQITKHVKSIVEHVVRSPNLTNPSHADAITRDWAAIKTSDDPARRWKAEAFAKLMTEFAVEHGQFAKLP